jgi:hypothetical protein
MGALRNTPTGQSQVATEQSTGTGIDAAPKPEQDGSLD